MRLILATLLSAAFSAGAMAAATPQTLEVDVEGLNCALCTEAMKQEMKHKAGALDIEPRLECGRIYLSMPPGQKLNEGALSFMLLSNGFNLKGVKPAGKSLAQVRQTAKETC